MAAARTGVPPRWLKPLNRVLLGVRRLGLGMRELPVLYGAVAAALTCAVGLWTGVRAIRGSTF